MKRWKLTIQVLFLPDLLLVRRGKKPLHKPIVRLYRWHWQARWAKRDYERAVMCGTLIITQATIEPLTFDNVVPFKRAA